MRPRSTSTTERPGTRQHVVALATWGALAWMGVGQATVWGILAGVFNSIPYFGPIIVSGDVVDDGGGDLSPLQECACDLNDPFSEMIAREEQEEDKEKMTVMLPASANTEPTPCCTHSVIELAATVPR